jgi:hypothetical protein
LHTIFGNGHSSGALQFTFVGQLVGRECLCSLLGIGVNRLRRALNLVPDLRFGHDKTGTKRETASVDAFLTVLYNGVAETLPDRPIIKDRKNPRIIFVVVVIMIILIILIIMHYSSSSSSLSSSSLSSSPSSPPLSTSPTQVPSSSLSSV